jgi:hypothetical protein
MAASKSILPIGVAALLLWPAAGAADVLGLKCSGTGTDLRYSKVEVDGRIYFTDKFGRIAVPDAAALAGKRVVVHFSGGQKTASQVPRNGNPDFREVVVPCR